MGFTSTERRLSVNPISSWTRVGRSPQTRGVIAGLILQQIFAIEFASDFCNARWPDSIGFLARRKTYQLCDEFTFGYITIIFQKEDYGSTSWLYSQAKDDR